MQALRVNPTLVDVHNNLGDLWRAQVRQRHSSGSNTGSSPRPVKALQQWACIQDGNHSRQRPGRQHAA